jgi:hypothetical protein
VPDLRTLTAATFAPFHHDPFWVRPRDAPPFEVELIEVVESADQRASRAPFSLVFRGGPDPPLRQRIYRVEHDELGALDIFFVPIGPDEVGQLYQAIFT